MSICMVVLMNELYDCMFFCKFVNNDNNDDTIITTMYSVLNVISC